MRKTDVKLKNPLTFTKQLLITYCFPGIVAGIKSTVRNKKTRALPALRKLTFYQGEALEMHSLSSDVAEGVGDGVESVKTQGLRCLLLN